jgi:hypothetical protein
LDLHAEQQFNFFFGRKLFGIRNRISFFDCAGRIYKFAAKSKSFSNGISSKMKLTALLTVTLIFFSSCASHAPGPPLENDAMNAHPGTRPCTNERILAIINLARSPGSNFESIVSAATSEGLDVQFLVNDRKSSLEFVRQHDFKDYRVFLYVRVRTSFILSLIRADDVARFQIESDGRIGSAICESVLTGF